MEPSGIRHPIAQSLRVVKIIAPKKVIGPTNGAVERHPLSLINSNKPASVLKAVPPSKIGIGRRPFALLNNENKPAAQLIKVVAPLKAGAERRPFGLSNYENKPAQPLAVSSSPQGFPINPQPLPKAKNSTLVNVPLNVSNAVNLQKTTSASAVRITYIPKLQPVNIPILKEPNSVRAEKEQGSSLRISRENSEANVATQIRSSKFFKPLNDLISEKEARQLKNKGAQEASTDREKQIRKKFEVHFKKPSIATMNCTQVEMPSCLEDILPSCNEYKVCHFEKKQCGFSAVIRTNIYDKESALRWIDIFETVTKIDLRSKDTFRENSDRIVFKKVYRCHCDTRADQPSSKTKKAHAKHTVCPANVIITVKNRDMKRSIDALLQTYPCEITVNYLHNHRVECADSLRHRRPSLEVKSTILHLFEKKHSPASALTSLKNKMQVKFGDDYFKHAADGSECPTYKWVYNLFHATYQKKYGQPSGEGMIETLKQFIKDYNDACGSECAKVATESEDIAVVICSPMMKRAHELLRSSGEMVTVDSSGNMDFQNTRVFFFVSPSVAGGIPVGVVFTTSEATYPLEKAFSLLKEVLPDKAFYGRGKDAGPKLFMTDDSTAERTALRTTFTAKDLVLLLCKFHLLFAMWRFLLDSKHNIKAACRPELYFLFKQLVDCPDLSSFNAMYDELISLDIVKDNKTFREHVIKKKETASEWAMPFRNHLLTRGHDTNNYNEVTTLCVKDQVFQRVKAYNMVQMFDFMTNDLDAYIKRRITDCLNNRMVNYTSSRYFIPEDKIKSLSVHSKISDTVYEVYNSESKKKYKVDLVTDVCSCPIGRTGAPCKHQYFLVKTLGRTSAQFVPINDPQAKMLLHKIMNGTTANVPSEWYENHKLTQTVTVNYQNNICEGTGTSTNEVEQSSEEAQGQNTVQGEEGRLTNDVTDADALSEDKFLCHQKLNELLEDMRRRLEERPEVYLPAYEKFLRRYDECKNSETTYVSAFHNFNRLNGHTSLRGGMREMTVQPTAIGRRKKYTGGKRAQRKGRPQEGFREENSRNKRGVEEANYAHLPSKKKMKLSHNISQNIMQTSVFSQKK
ncbi:hypothetical protein FOCC_FOCC017955 [Frankliniella occidentalis]|uniref:Uncharacterized protein LOC127752225 isoform X2 n=1 Tax=Frankliniella occidentalis TaxID=133901 RepID=A0A9C6XBU4_FRAOC|nr:uncharacterized protein LOC127752225 isoform X2 [Frankliniella occidentalis]KAE8736590.1 hypothetical protein FOCC_FOCC017955 [Frankliniella occidentalis]